MNKVESNPISEGKQGVQECKGIILPVFCSNLRYCCCPKGEDLKSNNNCIAQEQDVEDKGHKEKAGHAWYWPYCLKCIQSNNSSTNSLENNRTESTETQCRIITYSDTTLEKVDQNSNQITMPLPNALENVEEESEESQNNLDNLSKSTYNTVLLKSHSFNDNIISSKTKTINNKKDSYNSSKSFASSRVGLDMLSLKSKTDSHLNKKYSTAPNFPSLDETLLNEFKAVDIGDVAFWQSEIPVESKVTDKNSGKRESIESTSKKNQSFSENPDDLNKFSPSDVSEHSTSSLNTCLYSQLSPVMGDVVTKPSKTYFSSGENNLQQSDSMNIENTCNINVDHTNDSHECCHLNYGGYDTLNATRCRSCLENVFDKENIVSKKKEKCLISKEVSVKPLQQENNTCCCGKMNCGCCRPLQQEKIGSCCCGKACCGCCSDTQQEKIGSCCCGKACCGCCSDTPQEKTGSCCCGKACCGCCSDTQQEKISSCCCGKACCGCCSDTPQEKTGSCCCGCLPQEKIISCCCGKLCCGCCSQVVKEEKPSACCCGKACCGCCSDNMNNQNASKKKKILCMCADDGDAGDINQIVQQLSKCHCNDGLLGQRLICICKESNLTCSGLNECSNYSFSERIASNSTVRSSPSLLIELLKMGEGKTKTNEFCPLNNTLTRTTPELNQKKQLRDKKKPPQQRNKPRQIDESKKINQTNTRAKQQGVMKQKEPVARNQRHDKAELRPSNKWGPTEKKNQVTTPSARKQNPQKQRKAYPSKAIKNEKRKEVSKNVVEESGSQVKSDKTDVLKHPTACGDTDCKAISENVTNLKLCPKCFEKAVRQMFCFCNNKNSFIHGTTQLRNSRAGVSEETFLTAECLEQSFLASEPGSIPEGDIALTYCINSTCILPTTEPLTTHEGNNNFNIENKYLEGTSEKKCNGTSNNSSRNTDSSSKTVIMHNCLKHICIINSDKVVNLFKNPQPPNDDDNINVINNESSKKDAIPHVKQISCGKNDNIKHTCNSRHLEEDSAKLKMIETINIDMNESKNLESFCACSSSVTLNATTSPLPTSISALSEYGKLKVGQDNSGHWDYTYYMKTGTNDSARIWCIHVKEIIYNDEGKEIESEDVKRKNKKLLDSYALKEIAKKVDQICKIEMKYFKS